LETGKGEIIFSNKESAKRAASKIKLSEEKFPKPSFS